MLVRVMVVAWARRPNVVGIREVEPAEKSQTFLQDDFRVRPQREPPHPAVILPQPDDRGRTEH